MKAKKLALNKETLRRLETKTLKEIKGGFCVPADPTDCCPTRDYSCWC